MKKLLLFMLVFSPSWLFAKFSGDGSGTADDPYLITNVLELYQIRSNLSASFKLMNDIDMTDWLAENSPDTGWGQVGTTNEPFSGVFDGNGKTIRYFINQPSRKYAGLFACAREATIMNLNVVGDVIADNYVGGILGYAYYYVTITNCTFQGSVKGTGDVGGIVGTFCASRLENCFVSADIKGGDAGGLAGYTSSGNTIIQCCFWGEVCGNASSSYVGGIVGHCNDGSNKLLVTNSYFNGRLYVDNNGKGAGGIVGLGEYATILNCIAVSPLIQASTYVAGIVGKTKNTTTVTSCVAVVDTIMYNDASGNHSRIGAGGNIGTSSESLALSNMVVIKQDGETPDKVEEGGINGSNAGRSLLKMAVTYTTHDFDMKKTWDIDEGNGYPFLRCATDFIEKMHHEPDTPQDPDENEEDTDISELDNALYLESAEVRTGTQFALPIQLKNNVTVAGVSLTLDLPEGMTLVTDEDGDPIYTLNESRDKSSKFSVYFAVDADGNYGFRIMPSGTNTIIGTEGPVLTLMVNVANDMKAGTYPILLKSNSLSVKNSDGGLATLKLPDTCTTFVVFDIAPGDVNGDGDVDLTDAIMIVYKSLGVQQVGFMEAVADINGDGYIDLTDAIVVVYKSLGIEPKNAPARIIEAE